MQAIPPQNRQIVADLHCHSTASDGALSPSELVARAFEKGVTLLALTDHDTCDGWHEAKAAADGVGIDLLPGIELSCVWKNQTVHIVGLGFEATSPVMAEAVSRQQRSRAERAEIIAQKLEKRGAPPILEAAIRCAGGGVPGRPHFARALVEAGVVGREDHAFKRWLGNGKPGDVRAYWPEMPTVIDWIRDAGGIAVLAHPRKYGLSATKLRALLYAFREAGGEGLEVLTGGQSPGDTPFLAKLCQDNDLYASTGSDFHQPNRPWTELGSLPPLPKSVTPVWERLAMRVPQGE
ncbi:PHP domain-containing protein [Marinobacteraceae bacterium S3BR75-40.1]